MLDVEVHVPVEKTSQRTQQDSTCAQAKIGDIILQPGMLGVVAQESQPAAVEHPEGREHGHEPQFQIRRADDDQCMAKEQDSSPVRQFPSLGGIVHWKQMLLPLAVDAPQRVHERLAQRGNEDPRIEDRDTHEARQLQAGGQHDFQIIRWMQCVLVVLSMTRPEVHVIPPTKKTEEP